MCVKSIKLNTLELKEKYPLTRMNWLLLKLIGNSIALK